MYVPKIKVLEAKKLVGISQEMSLVENKTTELWQNFMPRRLTIIAKYPYLFSLQEYPEGYFTNFVPSTPFIKWALMEVDNFDRVPEGMQKFELKAGEYAVFETKNADAKVFQWIFTEWLPKSGYKLAQRPHFEVLGDKYKHQHPDSEEEIWIPIQ